MFGDIGWTEMLLIGIVALIVIGPEDLPQMFRQIGRFTAKIRAMSRDFSRAMEQAANEAGVKDMAKDIKAATAVGDLGLNKVKAAADRFEKWDPIKPKTKPLVPAPMPAKAEPVPAALPETIPAPDSILASTVAADLGDGPQAQPVTQQAIEPQAIAPQAIEPQAMAKSRAPRKKKEADPE